MSGVGGRRAVHRSGACSTFLTSRGAWRDGDHPPRFAPAWDGGECAGASDAGAAVRARRTPANSAELTRGQNSTQSLSSRSRHFPWQRAGGRESSQLRSRLARSPRKFLGGVARPSGRARSAWRGQAPSSPCSSRARSIARTSARSGRGAARSAGIGRMRAAADAVRGSHARRVWPLALRAAQLAGRARSTHDSAAQPFTRTPRCHAFWAMDALAIGSRRNGGAPPAPRLPRERARAACAHRAARRERRGARRARAAEGRIVARGSRRCRAARRRLEG
mmetsp:Transcript_9125/g.28691  ORF Transcript_9125/g.28691 Transcript_9125/m.28691 type:complete len:278 (-) Transcript_9125:15-848(-)